MITLIEKLLTKYQYFTRLPKSQKIIHICIQKFLFVKYNWKSLDQLLLSYKLHWQEHAGNILLFIFANFELFTALLQSNTDFPFQFAFFSIKFSIKLPSVTQRSVFQFFKKKCFKKEQKSYGFSSQN